MGKSRLVSTTIRRARDRGIATFVGECQPHGGRLAYLPWHGIWSALLGLPADAPPDAQREALLGGLGAVAPNLVPLAPLLGTVLDLPMDDNDATRSMPAVVRKQVLEQVLTGLLRGRASGGPVCIALEDLHWIDGLSRDLLATLAAAIADVPVLFVLSYRLPDAGAADRAPARAASTSSGELAPDEATDLATMLLTHVTEDIPDAATVEAVTERANGNPFFIEELVREIAARGGSTSDLPTSLENLILERIDRLTPGQKLTARVASVIGRRFSTAWLTDAFGETLDPARLGDDLAGLRASGLIVEDTPGARRDPPVPPRRGPRRRLRDARVPRPARPPRAARGLPRGRRRHAAGAHRVPLRPQRQHRQGGDLPPPRRRGRDPQRRLRRRDAARPARDGDRRVAARQPRAPRAGAGARAPARAASSS